jgi:hypothetical protein
VTAWWGRGGPAYLGFDADPIRNTLLALPHSLLVKVMLTLYAPWKAFKSTAPFILSVDTSRRKTHPPATLPPTHLHWAGSCAGRRPSLDALGKINSSCQCRRSSHDSNHSHPARSLFTIPPELYRLLTLLILWLWNVTFSIQHFLHRLHPTLDQHIHSTDHHV